jgi:hypothetical protein
MNSETELVEAIEVAYQTFANNARDIFLSAFCRVVNDRTVRNGGLRCNLGL